MAWPQAFEQTQQVLYTLRARKTSVFSPGVTGMGGQSRSLTCGDGGKEERTWPQQPAIQQQNPPRSRIPVPALMLPPHVKPTSSLPKEAAARECQGLRVPEGARDRDTRLLRCPRSTLRAGIRATLCSRGTAVGWTITL